MAKIFIIDTDESVVSDIKNLISDTTQNMVDFCNSVNDALGYLESNEPDIIITDIFPPKPECTKIIDYCAINHPNAKIILTSKRKSFSYARMAVRCNNVVDFVTKPIDADYTKELIHRLIHSAPALNLAESEHSHNKENELFSNIVHGYTTDTGKIQKAFESLELNISVTGQACTLAHFHVASFVTKEQEENLYDALRSAIPFETEDAYLSLTNYSYKNFSWFIVHKTQEDLPKRIANTLSSLKLRLEKEPGLTADVSSCKTWFSINDMLSGMESTQFRTDEDTDSTIANAIYFMRQNYQKDISLATVAEHVNMNPIYFSTYFKKHSGERFVNVLTSIRIEQAAKLLVTTNMTIKDIKIAVGYGHTGNFYKHFHDKYKMTPNEYKKHHQGVRDVKKG